MKTNGMEHIAFKAPFRMTIFHFVVEDTRCFYVTMHLVLWIPTICWWFFSLSFSVFLFFVTFWSHFRVCYVFLCSICFFFFVCVFALIAFGQSVTYSSCSLTSECYKIVKCAYIYIYSISISTFLYFCVQQVTGVVGRAETLSSVFFLLAFIFYVKSTLEKKSKLTGEYMLHITI